MGRYRAEPSRRRRRHAVIEKSVGNGKGARTRPVDDSMTMLVPSDHVFQDI